MNKQIKIGAVLAALFFLGLPFTTNAFFGFFEKPKNVFAESLVKIQNYNSLADNGTATFTSSYGMGVVKFSGKNNFVGKLGSSFEQNIDLVLNSASKSGKATTTLTLNADVKIVYDALYIRLNNDVSFGIFNLKPYKGKWIKIDNIKMRQYTENSSLRDLLNNAYDVVELPGSINSEHYKITLNKERMQAILDEAAKSKANRGATRRITGTVDDISKLSGEIWINRFNHNPSRIVLNISGTDNMNSPYTVNLDMNLSEFNKTFSIAAPDSPVSIQDVLSSMFGGASFKIKTK